jgi:tRNA nucleotidyltransferase (CCA-adding enzyme)
MNEHRADLGGPSPYTAEEPQAAADIRRDYTDLMHLPAKGDTHTWVTDGKHVLMGGEREPVVKLWKQMTGMDEMTGPHACGTVDVAAQWSATWQVSVSSISLHLLQQIAKKYSSDMGWKFVALTDDSQMPFEGLKTGSSAITVEPSDVGLDSFGNEQVVGDHGIKAVNAMKDGEIVGGILYREPTSDYLWIDNFTSLPGAGFAPVMALMNWIRNTYPGLRVEGYFLNDDLKRLADRYNAQLGQETKGEALPEWQEIEPGAEHMRPVFERYLEERKRMGMVHHAMGLRGDLPEGIEFQWNDPMNPTELTAWVGGQKVGIMQVDPNSETIANIGVPAEWQRRGVATALFDEGQRVWPDLQHSYQLSEDAQGWVGDHDPDHLEAYQKGWNPFRRQADVPGIGPINPGLKDWKNNDWAGTELFDQIDPVDYYGEQDEPDDEPAPGPRICSECHEAFPTYESWRVHVERSHINPDRKPNPMPHPVIDMDKPIPADLNTNIMDKTVQRQAAGLPEDPIDLNDVPGGDQLGKDRNWNYRTMRHVVFWLNWLEGYAEQWGDQSASDFVFHVRTDMSGNELFDKFYQQMMGQGRENLSTGDMHEAQEQAHDLMAWISSQLFDDRAAQFFSRFDARTARRLTARVSEQGKAHLLPAVGEYGPIWTKMDNFIEGRSVTSFGHAERIAAPRNQQPAIGGPIPFIYDIEKDKVFVGHPGERHSDIQGRFTPGGIIEGLYKPDGQVEIRTDTDMPYTVRHLIELWYYMHPELHVKGLYLVVGQEQYKLASANIGHKVRNMAFTDPAVYDVYTALSPYANIYVVGGAVRDVVMRKIPKDYDLLVQGLPMDDIANILQSSAPGYIDWEGRGKYDRDRPGAPDSQISKEFAVIFYRTHDGHQVEIALPRIEVSTGEGRRDFDIEMDPYLPVEQDLQRRDFTCNSMAVNLATAELTDPYQGVMDTREGVLRTVNPDAFAEDPSRLLRALAMVSQHGLEPDHELREMLKENAYRTKQVKGNANVNHLDKIFGGEDPARAMRLAMDTGLLHHLIPEVAATQGFDQKNKHHRLPLDQHLLEVLRGMQEQTSDPDARLAAFLHDIGKPASQWMDDDGYGHYYHQNDESKPHYDEGAAHEDVGAEMATQFMQRMHYPLRRIERVQHLVQHHMFPPFTGPNGAKKFLKRVGTEHASDLLKLRRADGSGKGTNEWENNVPVDLQEQLVQNVLHHKEPYALKDLAVNGHDLLAVGVPEGPGLGQMLNQLMDQVLENPSLNDRDTLLALVQQWLGYQPQQPTHMPQEPIPDTPHWGHTANILDPIHKSLDPDVFDHPEQTAPLLKPRLNRWVKNLIYSTMRDAGWPEPKKYANLVLTGSLTTYQWAAHSDFDVSLWIDSVVMPEWVRGSLISLMIETCDGTIVPGTTHPIQCYVVGKQTRKEDLYKPGLRAGFDLDTNKWLVHPEKQHSVDVNKEFPALINYCQMVQDKMQLLLKYDAYGSKTYWDRIHHQRMRDMKAGKGDYAQSNVVYKWLLNANLGPLIEQVTGERVAGMLDWEHEDHGQDLESRASRAEAEAIRPQADGRPRAALAADEGAEGQVEFNWPSGDDVLTLGQMAVDNWQGVRDPGLVHAAVGAAQNQHYYGGVTDPFLLAAHLINNIQRQQAIVEGNKRTATIAGLSFLIENGYPEAEQLLADIPLPMPELEAHNLPLSEQIVRMAEGQETPEQLAQSLRAGVMAVRQQEAAQQQPGQEGWQ